MSKSKKPSSTSKARPPDPDEDVTELVRELVARGESWDFLVVGDGSGSNWKRPIGWAARLVERASGQRQTFHGHANRGTVNVAEMMALLWPLLWIAAREAERFQAGGGRR